MNNEYVLKSPFEGIEFGPNKYRQSSAAPTNSIPKSGVYDLVPVLRKIW